MQIAVIKSEYRQGIPAQMFLATPYNKIEKDYSFENAEYHFMSTKNCNQSMRRSVLFQKIRSFPDQGKSKGYSMRNA